MIKSEDTPTRKAILRAAYSIATVGETPQSRLTRFARSEIAALGKNNGNAVCDPSPPCPCDVCRLSFYTAYLPHHSPRHLFAILGQLC